MEPNATSNSKRFSIFRKLQKIQLFTASSVTSNSLWIRLMEIATRSIQTLTATEGVAAHNLAQITVRKVALARWCAESTANAHIFKVCEFSFFWTPAAICLPQNQPEFKSSFTHKMSIHFQILEVTMHHLVSLHHLAFILWAWILCHPGWVLIHVLTENNWPNGAAI